MPNRFTSTTFEALARAPRFDARRAVGLTRWLLRQRAPVGDPRARLAAFARSDGEWPFRERSVARLAEYAARRLPAELLAAFEEARAVFEGSIGTVRPVVDVEVDWAGFMAGRPFGPGAARPSSDEPGRWGPTDPAAYQRLRRLMEDGDTSAARLLAVEARRRADLEVLCQVRDHALGVGDWQLVCELLAGNGEAFLEASFAEARRTDNRYLLDRTLELGAPAFLRRVYEDARRSRDDDSLHIALAALKALLPDRWQEWLPVELHHAANLAVPRSKYRTRLPPLPECLVCLAPEGCRC